MNIFKRMTRAILAVAVVMVVCSAPVVLPTSASALQAAPAHSFADSVDDACAGLGLTGASCKGTGGSKDISSVVKVLINLLTAIVGIAAVVMIIIGGFKYITSGGDSNNVASAKNTIIYAIVGLIVVAVAQLIVHIAIKTAT